MYAVLGANISRTGTHTFESRNVGFGDMELWTLYGELEALQCFVDVVKSDKIASVGDAKISVGQPGQVLRPREGDPKSSSVSQVGSRCNTRSNR